MPHAPRGVLSVLGRVLLCTIFFMSAVGNKIPDFNGTANVMESVGVPERISGGSGDRFLIVGRSRSWWASRHGHRRGCC